MNTVSAHAAVATRPASRGRAGDVDHVVPPAVVFAFVAAWALTAAGEVTGASRHLAHDAAVESALPPGVGLSLFLVGWVVMVSAMMLPATWPALRRLRGVPARGGVLGHFVGGFVVSWAVVGVAALGMDMVVHRFVAGVPSVASRPWLVLAAVLAVAGVLQLAPTTRRYLAAASATVEDPTRAEGWAAGWAHGARCIRADGPLMLVMFAVGTSLPAMVVLTAAMAGERSPHLGRGLAVACGVALLTGAALVAVGHAWLPAPLDVR